MSYPNNLENYSNTPYQQPSTVLVLNSKSTALAYILWFFLGSVGAHRFYLKSPVFGLIQLGMSVVGWMLSFLGIGFLLLVPLWIWLLFDLIWIPIRTGVVNNTAFDKIAARLS